MQDKRATADARFPADAHVLEELAELLGDPLPADWQEPSAITARQHHLAALACLTGDAMVEAVHAFRDMKQRDARFDEDAPAVRRFTGEMTQLYQGLRCYVHETQRDDGRQVITDALKNSLGVNIAKVVDHAIEQLIEGVRASMASA